MHISGNNFQHKNKDFKCNDSYYFPNISYLGLGDMEKGLEDIIMLSLKSGPK